MHDGVELESHGKPTAVIVTSVFEHEAHVQRAALGMDDLDPVVISHPLSTLSDEQIGQRVQEAIPQIKQVWLGG